MKQWKVKKSYIRNGKLIKGHTQKYAIPKSYKGYRVKFARRALKDYAGMNYWAAKDIGFRPLPKKDEIWLDDSLPKKTVFKNLIHEELEAKEMKKGNSYWTAHLKALDEEKKVK